MRTYNLINNKRNKKEMRQRNAACSAFGYMERGCMNWTDLLKDEG